ncbi:MAG: tRNA preQ1(34) S-adenosylmethionine ribosyltransferase-isomerase QueA [Ideonella sp.]
MAHPDRIFSLADFNFDLPPELIAQHPTPRRSASRLLDGRSMPASDHIFHELPSLLDSGDLLIFNNTRVIKARLLGHKGSGGAVEVLVERLLPGLHHQVWAHVRASKAPKAGSLLRFADTDGRSFEAEVIGRTGPGDGLFHLQFPSDPLALLEHFGHVPLPPYIEHSDDADDEQRYQTVFASRPGAVAAPTAALHFDQDLLGALDQRGILRAEVTLHVGAGTFLPVRSETIAEHRMHSEWFDIAQATVDAVAATRSAGGRVVAVGTTTLRALESAALSGQLTAGARETDIFITPGFQFRVVDRLVTNFHLPKSTLMMLVSAFAGHARVMDLYQQAISRRYRFFSYGDAMLLDRS